MRHVTIWTLAAATFINAAAAAALLGQTGWVNGSFLALNGGFAIWNWWRLHQELEKYRVEKSAVDGVLTAVRRTTNDRIIGQDR